MDAVTAHEAGRELDAVIAEKVFGWVVERDWACGVMPDSGKLEASQEVDGGESDFPYDRRDPVRVIQNPHNVWRDAVPFFSTNIADAWLVVEKMRRRGVLIDVETLSESFRVVAGWEGRDGEDIWMQSPTYFSPSAPLAICRAALAACDASSIMKATSGGETGP